MEAFQRCIERRDAQAADAVLDDDYALVLVHPTPAVMPRERWLAVLRDNVVHGYELQERFLDVSGDCACVVQRVAMRATVLGEDRSGTFVISDVWRRGGEGWRIGVGIPRHSQLDKCRGLDGRTVGPISGYHCDPVEVLLSRDRSSPSQ